LKSTGRNDSVVLLSGGLDSSTVLGIALSQGHSPLALSFSYGQRHSRELESAASIAKHYGVKQVTVSVDLGKVGGSSLTDGDVPVEHRKIEDITDRIPSSYVPARNSVFLSIAFGLAESSGSSTVFIGANSLDYSGYPDCRQEYFNAMEESLNLGTHRNGGAKIRIMAPLIKLTKDEIIRKGLSIGVPYKLTWSCYEGGSKACGKCDSCLLRLRGFMLADSRDPLEYSSLPDFYRSYLTRGK
jgi:7-cyano-7-deazaguanine synthase